VCSSDLILGSRGEQGEVVEEQDCNEVLSAYINSVTPEMLMMFEAYKANMEYDEFLKFRDRQD
jgi:hypothetical protein